MQIFTTEYSTKLLCSLADVLCTLKNLISLVKTGKQEGVLRESHTYVLGKRTLSLIVLCMSLGFTGSVLAQDVDLVSSPTSVEADQGDTFTVTIEIPQANSQPFNAASLFLNFDPAILQVTSVVAASGNQFTLPIGPSFDNLTGTINYTGTVIQTSFTAGFPILDVTFNVIGVSSTSIDFNINVGGSRNTNIALTGASVFGTAVSIPIIIASANEDPLADFTINPNPAETNEVVTFDGSFSTDDGSIASYAWDFGDGTTQTASGNASTTHSYTALNTYIVALTVTDNLGATNTTTKTIIVSSPTVNQFTVNASSNGNGTIDPSGAVSVNGGSDQTFNFTPDSGFEVSEVLVNSTAIIPVPTTSYTLTNVTAAAGISVSFSEIVTGPFQLCIASGSGDLTAFGRNFVGDPATAPPTGLGFTRTNGKTFTNYNGAIAGTSTADELTLFQKEIYGGAGGGNPSYIYDIPVANGFYQVDLYFAEVFHPAAGGRIFDVILDGNRILDEYDLVDPVKDGLNANQTAITRTYFVQVADGVMSLQIGAASTDNGKLSGICVTEVGNANLHPVSSIGDLTYDALVAVADPLNIQDPDNDLLSIVFNGMPASLTYNPSTNQLEGTPLATDGGTFTINAIISDGNNSPVTEEFTLVINPPAGNDPPVITAIADLAINEGEAISQAINVTDDNLPSATIEIFDVSEGGTNNPFTPTTAVAVGTLVDNTGGSYTFNWIPATGTGRSYLARVSADDGVNPLVIEEFRIDVAQQLPGTILARTFNNPVPWYGSSTPGGGLTIAIEPTAAKNIGYIDNGDFVEYLINVPIAGVYDFEVFAGKGNGGTTLVTFSEESGGGFAAIGSVNVIETGWQNYVSYTTQLSFANPGVQTLRFNFNGGANIRDFNFTPSTSNNAPIVTISSPADGIALTTGTTLNFTGSVTDVEDDDATLTAALNWSSDLQGNLSTGSNFSFALTTIGTHTITAEVTDSDAITPLSGSATISLIVTETDPSCDARFRVNAGGPVLIADSGDFEEDQVTVFPSGTALTGTPSPYINIITPAVDKTFGSTAPLVSNTTGYPDFLFQTERFSDALNPDNMKWIFPTGDGVYDVKILFNENWTGEIGNPRVFDVEIEGVIALNDYRPSGPAGADVNVAKVETYRATVADGVLNINFIQGTQNPSVKGFDICFVSDLPTDTPPVVAISSPTDNTTPVSIDRLVSTTFTAAVEDAEDDNTTLTNALVWSIDPIEANFAGTGGTFDDTLLVPGVYTIRASSTDSDTNTAFDEIEVTVLGPDVNFISPAGNADLATTNVQVTWSATKMNFGGTTPEHFHLWVNPADENNLVALDRISTASFPGQLFWDLTAIDGIVEGSNKVIIIAADSGHLEFLNIEARDEVNFNVLGDTTDPTITCLVNIVVDNNPGLCGAVVTFTTPIGEDDRPGAITTQTAGLASGDTFPIGITTQSYLVTDATGLTATCSFDVTVNDTEAPTLSCPVDQTVQGDLAGNAILPDFIGLAVASDNCDPNVVVIQSPAPGTTVSGTVLVTLTATDAELNSAPCTFNAIIEPAILASLTIVPSTITANLIQGETAMVNYVVDSDDASTLPTPAAMSIIDNATDNPVTWASTTSAANQGTSYEVNLDATGLTTGTYTAILTAGPVSGYTNAGIPITLIVEAVPTVLSVTSFTLVNADNEQDIMTITNGMTIDVTTLPTLNLNIRANTTSDVESVQMQLTGTLSKTATENFAPYALYGDSSGNYVAQIFVIGTYSLTANPYSGKSLGGTSGNTLTVNFELTDQEPVCASFSAGLSGITNPSSCLGVGSATAVPSGGVSPFTYQWDNGETTATAINLAAGPHSVIVVDDSGCSKTLTFTLTGPPIPVVTLAPFANLLNTAPAFTLTGGSPGGGTYSGPGVTGISFDPAIGVGTYAITYSYTDSNGCANSATRSITVTTETSNAALLVLDATDDSVLFALTDGLQINKPVIGNTPLGIIFNTSLNPGGVIFSLSGPITENRIEGPAPHSLFGDIGVDIQGKPFPVGNYTLVANPNVGPTITVNFSVTDADPLCVNFSASLSGITNPSTCLGFGSATAVPSGGVSPFTYQWDNGETMATANNLPVGPHSVIVGDANGCSKTLTLTLTGPPLPAVTLVPFASVLNTDLAFALTGGSPAGGTYSGAGVTGNTFDPAIGVGTYAITYSYTGPNGCANSATQSITVTSETGNAALLVLDATDDSVLFALTNGLQINKADIGNTPLGIIYNSSLNPGGVTFNLSGPINESRYEGPVPHSLFGDIGVNILGKPFPIGNYTLIANPVSGPTQTINFSVIDGPSGNQSALAARTQLNEMSIAPNPANKEVTMSFEKAILVEEILIFDITGKLIKTIKEPLGLDSKTIDFNVYDLPIGTYFIKTVDSEGMQYQQQMLIHRY